MTPNSAILMGYPNLIPSNKCDTIVPFVTLLFSAISPTVRPDSIMVQETWAVRPIETSGNGFRPRISLIESFLPLDTCLEVPVMTSKNMSPNLFILASVNPSTETATM